MVFGGLLLGVVLGAAGGWSEAPPTAEVARVDALFRVLRRDSARAPLSADALKQAAAPALTRMSGSTSMRGTTSGRRPTPQGW